MEGQGGIHCCNFSYSRSRDVISSSTRSPMQLGSTPDGFAGFATLPLLQHGSWWIAEQEAAVLPVHHWICLPVAWQVEGGGLSTTGVVPHGSDGGAA